MPHAPAVVSGRHRAGWPALYGGNRRVAGLRRDILAANRLGYALYCDSQDGLKLLASWAASLDQLDQPQTAQAPDQPLRRVAGQPGPEGRTVRPRIGGGEQEGGP